MTLAAPFPYFGRKRRARRARGRRRFATSAFARCVGAGWDECADCQRRTMPEGKTRIQPPTQRALWCENHIPPNRPEDQWLRKLIRYQCGVAS